MTLEWVHPGLLLILGAWVLPFLKGRFKRLAMLLLPAAALVDCLIMTPGTYGEVIFLGQELVFGRVDQLSLVFSYVFSIMAFLGMVFALHVEDDSQHVAALTYAGSALGVTFAGDFFSLAVFWELMAISSALLVWLRREPAAVAAGFRYLLVHVFGGLLLLTGIVLHWSQTGSLAFGDMGSFAYTTAWALILVASLLNAGVPPLGAWLPDAYPEATVTGAVFMTAFTTKSAVYVLIRGFVLFLARLFSVPADMFEAGRIDGARFFRLHRFITIPQLTTVILFYVVVEAITMVSWVFNYVYVMTNGQGGPGDATQVTELYIYQTAFQYQAPEIAAAAAVSLFAVTLVLIASFFRIQRRAGLTGNA